MLASRKHVAFLLVEIDHQGFRVEGILINFDWIVNKLFGDLKEWSRPVRLGLISCIFWYWNGEASSLTNQSIFDLILLLLFLQVILFLPLALLELQYWCFGPLAFLAEFILTENSAQLLFYGWGLPAGNLARVPLVVFSWESLILVGDSFVMLILSWLCILEVGCAGGEGDMSRWWFGRADVMGSCLYGCMWSSVLLDGLHILYNTTCICDYE